MPGQNRMFFFSMGFFLKDSEKNKLIKKKKERKSKAQQGRKFRKQELLVEKEKVDG